MHHSREYQIGSGGDWGRGGAQIAIIFMLVEES